MTVEEEHKENVATFAYNSLLVALNIPFEQIDGFMLHPRDGCDLPPIASNAGIPPEM